MREECKNFESRTYPDGETVRKCNLDLAPEAPWRCPESCPKYERRLADAAWTYGSLVTPPTPDEPEGEGIAELLDAAEDIINSVGPEVMAEVEEERRKQAAGGNVIARFGNRLRRKKR
jgi:hypothetical protein